MADSLPRPRPRPKPVAKKVVNAVPISTTGASSSSGQPASSLPRRRETKVEDTDEMFMRNRNRTSKTWQRLAEIHKGEFYERIYSIDHVFKFRNSRDSQDWENRQR